MTFTDDGVRMFQLASARKAIELEKMGMKHNRGNIKGAWAEHYGLSRRAKHDEVIAKITEEMEEINKRTK